MWGIIMSLAEFLEDSAYRQVIVNCHNVQSTETIERIEETHDDATFYFESGAEMTIQLDEIESIIHSHNKYELNMRNGDKLQFEGD